MLKVVCTIHIFFAHILIPIGTTVMMIGIKAFTIDDTEHVIIVPMKLVKSEDEYKRYSYTAKLSLASGGNYGYTFRVMPKHKMLLDSANLDLIKWITK